MSRIESRGRSVVTILLATTIAVGGSLRAGKTAPDRYVAKPDPTYTWKVTWTVQGNEWTQYNVL